MLGLQGYSSSKAAMIVATSQSIVQCFVMGLRDAVSVGTKSYPNNVIVSLSIKLLAIVVIVMVMVIVTPSSVDSFCH